MAKPSTPNSKAAAPTPAPAVTDAKKTAAPVSGPAPVAAAPQAAAPKPAAAPAPVSPPATQTQANGNAKPAAQQTAPARVAEPKQAPTYEQIARRAYEIYQARGGNHGHHHDDWLQAERELKLGKQ